MTEKVVTEKVLTIGNLPKKALACVKALVAMGRKCAASERNAANSILETGARAVALVEELGRSLTLSEYKGVFAQFRDDYTTGVGTSEAAARKTWQRAGCSATLQGKGVAKAGGVRSKGGAKGGSESKANKGQYAELVKDVTDLINRGPEQWQMAIDRIQIDLDAVTETD
jgi:hypothetical protein